MSADPPALMRGDLGILAWADRLIRRQIERSGGDGRWVVRFCSPSGGAVWSTCCDYAEIRAETARLLLVAFADSEGGTVDEKMIEAEKSVGVFKADPALMTLRRW